MSKFLLDYVFKILVNTNISAPSTAFLKQACLVVKAKDGSVDPGIYECTSMSQVAAKTDNTDAQQLFNAGMSRVYLLVSADLDLADALADATDFFTVLISGDFREKYAELALQDMEFVAADYGTGGNALSLALVDDDGSTDTVNSIGVAGNAITVHINAGFTKKSTAIAAILADEDAMALLGSASVPEADEDETLAAGSSGFTGGANFTALTGLDIGTFKGVVGVSAPVAERSVLEAQAVIANRSPWLGDVRNMVYAFGKLLANVTSWKNQQYIEMPIAGVDNLGDAESLFDDRINFVVTDDSYGNRLALFVAGGKAIVAPYVLKNLCIDLQGYALIWINKNNPDYNKTQASLLEDYLTQRVIQEIYIAQKWLTSASLEITLVQDNFVANGDIQVVEPRALWRIAGELTPS